MIFYIILYLLAFTLNTLATSSFSSNNQPNAIENPTTDSNQQQQLEIAQLDHPGGIQTLRSTLESTILDSFLHNPTLKSFYQVLETNPKLLDPILTSKNFRVYTLMPQLLKELLIRPLDLNQPNYLVALEHILTYPNLVDWEGTHSPSEFIMTGSEMISLSSNVFRTNYGLDILSSSSASPSTRWNLQGIDAMPLQRGTKLLRFLMTTYTNNPSFRGNINFLYSLISAFPWAAYHGLNKAASFILDQGTLIANKNHPLLISGLEAAILNNQVSTVALILKEAANVLTSIDVPYFLTLLLGNQDIIHIFKDLFNSWLSLDIASQGEKVRFQHVIDEYSTIVSEAKRQAQLSDPLFPSILIRSLVKYSSHSPSQIRRFVLCLAHFDSIGINEAIVSQVVPQTLPDRHVLDVEALNQYITTGQTSLVDRFISTWGSAVHSWRYITPKEWLSACILAAHDTLPLESFQLVFLKSKSLLRRNELRHLFVKLVEAGNSEKLEWFALTAFPWNSLELQMFDLAFSSALNLNRKQAIKTLISVAKEKRSLNRALVLLFNRCMNQIYLAGSLTEFELVLQIFFSNFDSMIIPGDGFRLNKREVVSLMMSWNPTDNRVEHRKLVLKVFIESDGNRKNNIKEAMRYLLEHQDPQVARHFFTQTEYLNDVNPQVLDNFSRQVIPLQNLEITRAFLSREVLDRFTDSNLRKVLMQCIIHQYDFILPVLLESHMNRLNLDTKLKLLEFATQRDDLRVFQTLLPLITEKAAIRDAFYLASEFSSSNIFQFIIHSPTILSNLEPVDIGFSLTAITLKNSPLLSDFLDSSILRNKLSSVFIVVNLESAFESKNQRAVNEILKRPDLIRRIPLESLASLLRHQEDNHIDPRLLSQLSHKQWKELLKILDSFSANILAKLHKQDLIPSTLSLPHAPGLLHA